MVPDLPSFEIPASAETAAAEDSRFVREAVNGRLLTAADQGRGTALWAQGLVGWGLTGRDGEAGRLDRLTDGAFAGADTDLPGGWRVGVLGGRERTSLRSRLDPAAGTVASDHLGLYAGGQWGPVGLRLGAAYAWRRLEMERKAVLAGSPKSLASRYHGGLFQTFGELGYRLPFGPATVEPFVGGAYVAQKAGAYAETGPAVAFTGKAESRPLGFAMLGLRETAPFEIAGVGASLTGAIGWRRAFGRLTPYAAQAWAGGPAIDVPGGAVARNAATLEGGLSVALPGRVALGLTYNGQIGANLDAVAVRAGLHWSF